MITIIMITTIITMTMTTITTIITIMGTTIITPPLRLSTM
jgi:hypothetical protein